VPTHTTCTHIHLDPINPPADVDAWAPKVGDWVSLRLLPDVLNLYGTREQLTDLLRAGLTALYADSPTEPAIPDTDPEPAPVTPLPVPALVATRADAVDRVQAARRPTRWAFGPLGMEEVGPDAS